MSLLIYGRNSVIAAINSKRVSKIYIGTNFNDKRIKSLAKENKLPMEMKSNNELSDMVRNAHHQGVIAVAQEYKYFSLDDLIEEGNKIENPIIIMLDGIEDPHNLGAILRVADSFNVVGIIVKKTSQAPLNATVDKVSTGAINFVRVAAVSNLSNTIRTLKDCGYWVVATDSEGKDDYYSIDYKMPVVLIIGSEGLGIQRLVKDNSDFLVKIPLYGHVNSLNASNALSIVLSHIIYSRKTLK